MYVPDSFNVDDPAQIQAFLRRYDFATIVSSSVGAMVATHVPLVVRAAPTGLVLAGHVARANSHWELMNGTTESLVIFLGPHAYVSPKWYASSPAVPTWNYGSVHAYGKLRAIHDVTFTKGLLGDLVSRHEQGPTPWRIEDLPPPFSDRLLSAIVAFEMPVDRLEAKFKLGQNRTAEDRDGTIAGLEQESSHHAAELAAFMRSHLGD